MGPKSRDYKKKPFRNSSKEDPSPTADRTAETSSSSPAASTSRSTCWKSGANWVQLVGSILTCRTQTERVRGRKRSRSFLASNWTCWSIVAFKPSIRSTNHLSQPIKIEASQKAHQKDIQSSRKTSGESIRKSLIGWALKNKTLRRWQKVQ